LAAELKEKYGVEAILVSSDGGVFEVKVDENLVFSKKQSGRFPEDNEVPDKINAL
jgi:selenoprotein W-related protein